MPRRKKVTTNSAASNVIGEAFAPMIREIVRDEIARMVAAVAREYGLPESAANASQGNITSPISAPDGNTSGAVAAPETHRNGRDKRNKGESNGATNGATNGEQSPA